MNPIVLTERFRDIKISRLNLSVLIVSVRVLLWLWRRPGRATSTTDGTDNTDLLPGIRGIPVIRGQKLVAPAAALLILASLTAPAQPDIRPEVVPAREPPRVFGGGARTVPVMWRSTGNRPASLSLSTRFYQASSATAAPLSQTPWKELTILPGQTVLESVTLDVPVVRAETRFLVQWLQNSNNALGVTEVWAYPTNILRELGALAGVEPAGLYDPQNQLKPLLRAVHVEYVDLEEAGLERFVGKLVIAGPFASREQVCEWLPDSLRSLAMRGVAVVWLLPPLELRGKIKPSFYTVIEGKGAVVVVQAGVIGDLGQDPQAQLDLVRLCGQAVKPQSLQLPFLASQP